MKNPLRWLLHSHCDEEIANLRSERDRLLELVTTLADRHTHRLVYQREQPPKPPPPPREPTIEELRASIGEAPMTMEQLRNTLRSPS